MTMKKDISQLNARYTSSHYAVVDLGSNSFHLQITEHVSNQIKIVDKIKQKVRLASGLNDNNEFKPLN